MELLGVQTRIWLPVGEIRSPLYHLYNFHDDHVILRNASLSLPSWNSLAQGQDRNMRPVQPFPEI